MVIVALIAITLPVFSQFLPQTQTSGMMDPRLMEEMLKANDSAKEASGQLPGEQVEGAYQVTDVLSGNTLSVLWGDVEETVKLIGVKAIDGSKEELKSMLLGDIVQLEFDAQEKDAEGNLLAYAYREDGLFINREMIALGYAKCSGETENVKYESELEQAEVSAKAQSLGCWAPGTKE